MCQFPWRLFGMISPWIHLHPTKIYIFFSKGIFSDAYFASAFPCYFPCYTPIFKTSYSLNLIMVCLLLFSLMPHITWSLNLQWYLHYPHLIFKLISYSFTTRSIHTTHFCHPTHAPGKHPWSPVGKCWPCELPEHAPSDPRQRQSFPCRVHREVEHSLLYLKH